MNSKKCVLAVLGGGSVATTFLRQFAQRASREGGTAVDAVLVFDPRPQPGAGGAYQQDNASNLLNTRAAGMSALNSDSNHFYRWALRNESQWRHAFPEVQMKPDAYVPRALFGLYLDSVYDESVALLAEQGVGVHHVQAAATCLRQTAGRYEVSTDQGSKHLADMTVLALGNQESTLFDHLRPYAGYFPTPYPCSSITAQIDRDRSVGILGSNLSAIDAAVSLLDAGHRGKILMVSRNGRLPSVRGAHNVTRTPTLLSRQRVAQLARERGGRLRLREVADLVIRELEMHEGGSPDLRTILRSNEGPQRYLDAEIEQASVRDRVWQAVVYGMNDAIDLIWHHLPDEDRRVFERDFKSQWLSYRVSFPLDNARKLQQLLHSDQLSVYGGCAEVCFNDAMGQFSINVADTRKSFAASMYTDCLVNATGYTTQVTQCASPLLRSLVASGQARSHEFGGIDVDFDTSLVLARSGRRHDGLFALGSMVSGTYFWTNAMNVNCRLADNVARHVFERADLLDRARSLPPALPPTSEQALALALAETA
jgi:uncharacterized NAD(P)/FAD-binding protein YdhS